MHSVDFYLPYLFTYQQPGCEGMPNTNNKIEEDIYRPEKEPQQP